MYSWGYLDGVEHSQRVVGVVAFRGGSKEHNKPVVVPE